MSDTSFELFVTCSKGQEDLMLNELQALGIDSVQMKVGGVSAQATLRQSLLICLWSRIANRVLLRLSHFIVNDEHELYHHMYAYPWHEVMDVSQTFAIDCKLHKTEFTHDKYLALKSKDAVVDYFRNNTGERPSVQTSQPEIQLSLYIDKTDAIIYLDLSGDSLHRRGYRVSGERAPLKENLAAAILYRCKWPERAKLKESFIDPMCGSGTLLIEAALMASNTAPGLNRTYYGFMGWKQFDFNLWNEIKTAARNQQDLSSIPSITGYDNDSHAIYACKQNIEASGLQQYIHIEKRDITKATPRKPGDKGIIVVNPPYGERLGELEQVTQLYKTMGEQFREQFLDWDAFVFTNSLELGKALPLRAFKVNAFYNGPIECKLLHFHINPQWFFESTDGFRYMSEDRRDENSKMFANRFEKNYRHLKKWAKRENIDCYRVYDADLPEYSLAIDLYQSDKLLVNVQEYEAPKDIPEKVSKKRLNDALSIIQDMLQVERNQLYLKTRKQQKGAEQYEKQDSKPEFHQVQEGGLTFYINLKNYLDTGIFLDHRKTRAMICSMSDKKSVLNLFCYTGAVSVYAAAGGASSVTSVDMSRTYLEWAEKNFELNKFKGKQYEFIQADCLQWLKHCDKKYDLIFLDPPSFSNSKRMESDFSVQDDHEQLIEDTMLLLNKDGVLIFSNNFRRFKMAENILNHYSVSNISGVTLPEDFKRNPKIHNCWKISRL